MNRSSVETVQTPAGAPQVCMPQELVASTVFLLARLGYSIKLQMIEDFEQEGFSPYHYSVLALLEEGARETQGTIADALRLDRSQLVGLLDVLEEHGLVERRRDRNDRRRHVVSLTPAGRRQLAAFRKLVKRSEGEILASLAPDERAVLHGLLLRLAGNRDARFAPRDPAAA